MTAGFNRKWISCAAVYFILLTCCVWGIYTFFTREISTDEGIMSSGEKNLFIGLFFCIGIASAAALIKLITRIKGSKGCFTVDENGISDAVVLFNIFTLYFVFDIKNIPWKAISSIEKEDARNLVHAKIAKEYINEVTASPVAKIVLKYFGFSFGHGLADMQADAIINICHKYMGKRCE